MVIVLISLRIFNILHYVSLSALSHPLLVLSKVFKVSEASYTLWDLKGRILNLFQAIVFLQSFQREVVPIKHDVLILFISEFTTETLVKGVVAELEGVLFDSLGYFCNSYLLILDALEPNIEAGVRIFQIRCIEVNFHHIAQKSDVLSSLARYYLILISLCLLFYYQTLLVMILPLSFTPVQSIISNTSFSLRIFISTALALHFPYI